MTDPVNNPAHYTQHPSGVECITITEHMGFNLGNAVKYIWRADLKGDVIQDLEKAAWYVAREIQKRKASIPGNSTKSVGACVKCGKGFADQQPIYMHEGRNYHLQCHP